MQFYGFIPASCVCGALRYLTEPQVSQHTHDSITLRTSHICFYKWVEHKWNFQQIVLTNGGKKKKKVLSFLTEHYWLLIQGYQARRPVQGRLRVHIVRPAQVQRRQWRRAPDKRGVLHSFWWVRLHLFFHHQESFLTLERLNTVPEKQGFVLHLTFCHPTVKTFNVSYFIYWMYWSLLSSSRHTGP